MAETGGGAIVPGGNGESLAPRGQRWGSLPTWAGGSATLVIVLRDGRTGSTMSPPPVPAVPMPPPGGRTMAEDGGWVVSGGAVVAGALVVVGAAVVAGACVVAGAAVV